MSETKGILTGWATRLGIVAEKPFYAVEEGHPTGGPGLKFNGYRLRHREGMTDPATGAQTTPQVIVTFTMWNVGEDDARPAWAEMVWNLTEGVWDAAPLDTSPKFDAHPEREHIANRMKHIGLEFIHGVLPEPK